MAQRTTTEVLAYHAYVGADSQTVYGTRYFCGECRRGIGGVYGSACYGYPEYPEDLEAKNERGLTRDRPGRELEHYSFCPWCGSRFEIDWWRDQTIQNERVIDHYQNPGTHKGDTHEFHGFGMAGHWLAVSGGDTVCWCDPDIEPGIMGCIIRHKDKPPPT